MTSPGRVIAGFLVGLAGGALVGSVIGKQEPFTVNPPDRLTPLDEADQALATFAGGWIGAIAGVSIALAT